MTDAASLSEASSADPSSGGAVSRLSAVGMRAGKSSWWLAFVVGAVFVTVSLSDVLGLLFLGVFTQTKIDYFAVGSSLLQTIGSLLAAATISFLASARSGAVADWRRRLIEMVPGFAVHGTVWVSYAIGLSAGWLAALFLANWGKDLPDVVGDDLFAQKALFRAAQFAIIFIFDKGIKSFVGRARPTERVAVAALVEPMTPQRLLLERRQVPIDDRPAFERLQVLVQLQERLSRLRLRSSLILLAILAALIGCAGVILFAGQLTSSDVSAVSNVDRISSQITEAQRRSDALATLIDLYKRTEATPSSEAAALAPLNAQINSLKLSNNFTVATSDGAARMLTQQSDTLAVLNKRLDEAWTKQLAAQASGEADFRYLGATTITRIGIVLILVYLVQILVGLYRYNTRLVAFYAAKADFLSLWDGTTAGAKTLEKFAAPPNVDFGKEPRPPIQELMQALGAHAGSATSKVADTARAVVSRRPREAKAVVGAGGVGVLAVNEKQD